MYLPSEYILSKLLESRWGIFLLQEFMIRIGFDVISIKTRKNIDSLIGIEWIGSIFVDRFKGTHTRNSFYATTEMFYRAELIENPGCLATKQYFTWIAKSNGFVVRI